MTRRGSRWTRSLAVALVASIVGGVSLAAWWSRPRMQTAASLGVVVGELRARAGELELLAEEAAAGRLPDRFVRVQADQLLRQIDASTDELASRPPNALAAAAQEARSLALSLELAAQTLAQNPRGATGPGGPLRTAASAGAGLDRLRHVLELRQDDAP